MKSSAFFALFLLCAFTSYLPSAIADFVLDMDGDALLNGGTYYVMSSARGRVAGIERASIGRERCPSSVVQSPSEDSTGLPIRLSSPLRIITISDGYMLNIEFAIPSRCDPDSSSWTIIEGPRGELDVKLSGYRQSMGAGWFKIEKADDDSNYRYEPQDYKLMFCPNDSSYRCYDIGVYEDRKGNRRLVVTENEPLLVRFKKVESRSTA